MKTNFFLTGLALALASPAAAQSVTAAQPEAPATATAAAVRVANQSHVVGERGPHDRAWLKVTTFQDAQGRTSIETNLAYVEVASGLNYLDETGQWQDSQDLIELSPDGAAAALHGPMKVHFSPNLNTAGAITFVTASNRVVRTHLLGLYYYDAATGQSVLLAPLQDAIGELLPPNQVLYRSAFESVKADVRFTYTKAAFECDVILKGKPAPPEAFGLDPATTRLEVWHEYLDSPAPQRTPRLLKQQANPALRKLMVEPDLVDETLDFGDAWFPLGRAFSWDAAPRADSTTPAEVRLADPAGDPDQVPVAKQWHVFPDADMGSRQVLIESVDWLDVKPKLDALPRIGATTKPSKFKGLVMNRRQPQAVRPSTPSNQAIKTARLPYDARGYVLDYIIVSGSGSYTFDSATTYYLSSGGYFGGTVTFQPGCVLKFANNTSLILYGYIYCNGTTASPSVLTSKDDNLYGETIAGSTGNPTYTAGTAVSIYCVNYPVTLQGMRIRWAHTGVSFSFSASLTHCFNNSSLEACQIGLYSYNCCVSIYNSTKCSVQTPTYCAIQESSRFSGTLMGGVAAAAAPSSLPSCFSGTLTDDCHGDTDCDGLADSWEQQWFGNLNQNGGGDYDSDGVSNLLEYLQGRNPTVGAVADTGNQTRLQVYTPLQ